MNIIDLLVTALSNGDTAGIVILTVMLFAGCIYTTIWLSKDRKRIIKTVGKRDDDIKELMNKYQESQIANINALTALKELLLEMRAIIKYKGTDND